MARYYNRRRFARRVRRVRRSKKSSLSRVKKDIMKCNFPTKVKFMGLTEKKVMFLTKTMDLKIGKHTIVDNNVSKDFKAGQIIILDPLNTENVQSLGASPTENDDTVRIYNWDKICILGIYIKFQPKRNMWEDDGIAPVKCIYSSHIIPTGTGYNDTALTIEGNFVNSKQVFTFNSNEAFTMYLPAPTTMSSENPCVHRSKTWWSLFNIGTHATSNNIQNEYGTVEEENTDDLPEYSAITGDSRPYVSAGVLFLTTEATANYNVTINYKVALKG